nr:MAG TPA: hypothetical protein [Caudoviricetes sp.]
MHRRASQIFLSRHLLLSAKDKSAWHVSFFGISILQIG